METEYKVDVKNVEISLKYIHKRKRNNQGHWFRLFLPSFF